MIPLFFMAIAIPVLVLLVFGLFALYRDGYIFHFAGLLAISTLLPGLVMMIFKKKLKKEASSPGLENGLVKPSVAWSDYDTRVWNALNQHISEQLEQGSKWEELREHALDLVLRTAEKYHEKKKSRELHFSAPELLKMIEEVARRYRLTLKAHVPFVGKVNLSTLKILYDHKEKTNTARKAWNLYRIYRVSSPVGMISEIRAQMLGKVMGGVSAEFQYKLKQAFLQEVLSVAIDLYSGRFKVDDDALDTSIAATEDTSRMAAPIDPLRISFLGQLSAGKSAIINALMGDMVAEVSKLPSTTNTSVYQCRVEGIDILHLVDLPGLDGTNQTEQRLLTEVTHSDIVVWVLKANQPARQRDTAFRAKLDAFYADAKNRSRRRPAIIGVLNQVDRLKPLSEWQPPYDIDTPTSPKAQAIKEALQYNKQLLQLEILIPLSVSDDKPHFNLPRLKSLLTEEYANGVQAQLNRRRLESADKSNLFEQAKPAIQAGKTLFGAIKRNLNQ